MKNSASGGVPSWVMCRCGFACRVVAARPCGFLEDCMEIDLRCDRCGDEAEGIHVTARELDAAGDLLSPESSGEVA